MSHRAQKIRRLLVLRLSSLGDVLLATSFLENLPENTLVDWVVRSEFEFALKGHPKIHRLIPFAKKSKLSGWLQLVRQLATEPYAARIDLHRNLRSAIALAAFRVFDFARFRYVPHYRVSKQRFRTTVYFLTKKITPKFQIPTPYWIRFGKMGQRVAHSLTGLASNPKLPKPPSYLPVLTASGHDERHVLAEYDLFPSKYFAVMPAASFRTKEWGADRYCELIDRHYKGLTPVLLGRETDPACLELRAALKSAGIFFKDALSEVDFKKTAILLKYAQFYLGSDTGLAHLSEAVGTRSFIIFGPTRPGLGFGPWREESKSIELPLACSPCSKDGKFCYRFASPYACLRKLEVSDVRRKLSL
jgi:ADP-heptose:LPS heptosyltransferase